MTDLLEAAEALLYVLGSDHSQGEYQTAVDGLAVAVRSSGGEVAPSTVALAPGHAPTIDDAAPADLAPSETTPADVPATAPAASDTGTDKADGGSTEVA